MKKNRRHALAWLMVALIALPLSAQQQFTLEDLNFGGKNYRNMIAKNRSLTWWGDQLLRLSADTCWKVNPVNGKEKVLFTRDAINKGTGLADDEQVTSLSYASFPYPDKPVAVLYNHNERMLVNFKTRKVEWRQERSVGAVAEEWNKNSRAMAFVMDDNLCVTDAAGDQRRLTRPGLWPKRAPQRVWHRGRSVLESSG